MHKQVYNDFVPVFLSEAVVVDITNVADYIWHEVEKLPKDGPASTEALINFTNKFFEYSPNRLPFPSMWFEWSETVYDENEMPYNVQTGCLITEVRDYSKAEQYKKEGRLKDELPLLPTQLLFFQFVPELGFSSLVAGGEMQIDQNNPNRWSEFFYHKIQPPEEYCGDLESGKVIAAMIGGRLSIILSALAFFACKNVEIRQIENHKKQHKLLKKYSVIRPTFHVIEIHKKAVRNVYERGIEKNKPALQHAHLVRGHFKTYTEENKLLGKISGTWFWQSHVRGDIGIPTVSDYRVWPASEKHKPKCNIQ